MNDIEKAIADKMLSVIQTKFNDNNRQLPRYIEVYASFLAAIDLRQRIEDRSRSPFSGKGMLGATSGLAQAVQSPKQAEAYIGTADEAGPLWWGKAAQNYSDHLAQSSPNA